MKLPSAHTLNHFMHMDQSAQFFFPLAFSTAWQIPKCTSSVSSTAAFSFISRATSKCWTLNVKKREWTFRTSSLPTHFLPFSWNPGSQPQWKLPIVLKQRWWQELDSWHSLTSVEQHKSLTPGLGASLWALPEHGLAEFCSGAFAALPSLYMKMHRGHKPKNAKFFCDGTLNLFLQAETAKD